MIVGILMLLLVDQNMGFGIMAAVCFAGAFGYDSCAKAEWETILINLYEGSGND